MAKNKQQIKFEADITGFKNAIKEGEQSIRSLTKELKLNQEQLKGNNNNTDLLSAKVKNLEEEYRKQTEIVEQTNNAYEKAVELLGENSEEAKKWKDKLVEAETKQQKIKNALEETNKQLAVQKDKLITIGKQWQETGEKIVTIGNKINTVGNKLSVVSAGTAAIATAALKASIDYESAFAGVEKTVDATEEQFAKLRAGILEMSTRMPASATEIAKVAEAAGQLGIETDNILSFSEAMIGLGESTNLSADEAATQLARFANIMQMSQTDFDKLGSTIVDLGNNFATTEAEIVNMAMRLAGAGKQVGLSEGQVMGLSAALSSVGVEAEMGGSAISKAMVKMQNAVETGGDKLNTVLNKTGMSLRELQLLSANKSKNFKALADSIGMTSTELNQLITAGANLEDFARVSGMTAEQFQKAWKEDAAGALTAFIQGLGHAEDKGESAITMLTEMGLTEVRLRDSLLRAANAGDLFNTAIETGTKAWKQNTALTTEVNKRYKTTESQMKMLKNEATKLAIEFGNQLAPSLRQLLKDTKPILNTISDAIKKFSQLDSKTKQNIIRFGALVIASGPVVKTLGNVTIGLGKTVSGFGKLSEALGNAKVGITGTGKEVTALTRLISGMASPLGIVTLGVTALAGAYVIGKINEKELTEEMRKNIDAIKDQINSRKELKEAVEKEQSATASHMQTVTDLTNELETLVDANGKVKEGYKDRVSFILNELNNALGTEFHMTGDVIDKYKDLKKSVDDVVRSKRANAILEAEEALYNEAINNKAGAYESLAKAQQDVLNYEAKIAEWEQKNGKSQNLTFWEKVKQGFTVNTTDLTELENLKTQLRVANEEAKKAETNYKEIMENINTYTQDATILLGEDVEAQEKLLSQKMVAHRNASEDIAESTKLTVENYLYDLKMYEQYRKEALEKQDETAAKSYQKQIESNKKGLAEHVRSMTAMIDTTKNMTPAQVEVWRLLATESFDTYAEVLNNLDDETIKKIQDATGRVISDEQLAEAFKKLGRKSIDGFKKNDFEKAGQDAVQGISDGANSKMGLIESLSRKISEKLRIVASVSATGSSANGHADGIAYVPSNNYVARLHEGERVLTKKQNRDYTRNINNNNQSFVVNIYPQTMTEQEMIKVSNFIEREWGRRS